MYKYIAVFLILLASFGAYANPYLNQSTQTQLEINHLLELIADSECLFIRNRKKHKPTEALKHIRKKQAHFKEKIHTAEDFIRYSATGSLVSKKDYYIECAPNKKQPSAQWLQDRLDKYRAKNTKESLKE